MTLVTYREAARILCCSLRTLHRRYISTALLPRIITEHGPRIRLATLKHYIEAHSA